MNRTCVCPSLGSSSGVASDRSVGKSVQTAGLAVESVVYCHVPVVSADDPYTVVGSVGERGLLKHAMRDPQIMNAEIAAVMEAPFTGVSTVDPVREAVELLTGDTQALIVSEHGRPVGIVTRTDLLESLVS